MQILGVAILAAVLLGLFVATATSTGFWAAVGIWSMAFLLTGLVVLGASLAVG